MISVQLFDYQISLSFRSATVIPDWDKNWNKSYEKAQKEKKTCSVIPTLVYTYGPKFAISGFLQLLYSILQFANPQIVNLLITFVSSDEPTWKGYFYTALICAVTFLNTLINAQGFFLTYKLGLRLKSAMISAIYRKSLRLSNTGRKEMTSKHMNVVISSEEIELFIIHRKIRVMCP